jgi:hypothetical protein
MHDRPPWRRTGKCLRRRVGIGGRAFRPVGRRDLDTAVINRPAYYSRTKSKVKRLRARFFSGSFAGKNPESSSAARRALACVERRAASSRGRVAGPPHAGGGRFAPLRKMNAVQHLRSPSPQNVHGHGRSVLRLFVRQPWDMVDGETSVVPAAANEMRPVRRSRKCLRRQAVG